jgi:predicted LPLAT superfamily acyltransferase
MYITFMHLFPNVAFFWLQTADSTERASTGFLVRSSEALKQSRDSKLHQVTKYFQSLPHSQVIWLLLFVIFA